MHRSLQPFCCVFFKPDVTRRDILESVLNWFEQREFKLLDYRCGGLGATLYGLMYGTGFRWDLDDWEHNRRAFEHGPTIGTMFWREESVNSHGSAQEYLRQVKGAALPSQVIPGTLRHQFRSTSRVYNILHVADTTAEAFKQAEVWFGRERLAEITGRMLTRSPAGEQRYASRVAQEVWSHGYLLERETDGELTWLLVKRRITHALSKTLSVDEETGDLVTQLEQLYVTLANRRLCNRRACSEMSPEHETDEEDRLLQRLLARLACGSAEAERRDRAATLCKVMSSLSARSQGAIAVASYFWHLVTELGVYTSEFERYLVDTLFRYPWT
jgi:nucleoside diphosphate kinase